MEGTTNTNNFLHEFNTIKQSMIHKLTFFPQNIENSTAPRAAPQKDNHCQTIKYKKKPATNEMDEN